MADSENKDSENKDSEKKQRKPRSDKGMKRETYRQNLRSIRAEGKALQRIVDDIEKFEKIQKRLDFSGESKSRAERKREQRLQQLPTPRICPYCLKAKPKSKQWVIKLIKGVIKNGGSDNSDLNFVGCKSCLWKLFLMEKGAKDGIVSIDCNQQLGETRETL